MTPLNDCARVHNFLAQIKGRIACTRVYVDSPDQISVAAASPTNRLCLYACLCVNALSFVCETLRKELVRQIVTHLGHA